MFILTPILMTTFAGTDLHIQDVVPETTIAVISTDNIGSIVNSLESMGICNSVCELSSAINSAINGEGEAISLFGSEESNEMFATLGIDKESFTPPTGSAGFAIYPVVDYEVGSVGIGLFGLIELESTTYNEDFRENVEQLIETAADVETVNISGRDVWMVDFDLSNGLPMPMDTTYASMFNRAYISCSDGYLLLGTEPDAFGSAFAALDGDPEEGMLAGQPDYLELVQRCGEDGDMFAAVLLTNLADTIVQMDQSGMSMMFLPTIKNFFGDVDGIAESIAVSPSPEIIVDATYTLLMNDGRSGLLGLMGENSTLEEIPSFVQADAITYSQGQIDLDKFVPLIKEMIANDPMINIQLGSQIAQIESGLNLFLNPLGSKYHTFSTGQLPFDADSIGYLIAIECKDEKTFSNALGVSLPMMGAVPSDFLGNQIFTIDFGAALPMPLPMSLEMSISVGGGYAFFGTTTTVEQALRSIANPKNNASVDSHAMVSVLSHDDVSAWGYSDLKKSIELQTAMTNSMSEGMFEEMEAFDPAMAAEMRAEFEQSAKLQTQITEMIASMLGPLSWNMKTDDSGFIAHAVMFHPSAE